MGATCINSAVSIPEKPEQIFRCDNCLFTAPGNDDFAVMHHQGPPHNFSECYQSGISILDPTTNSYNVFQVRQDMRFLPIVGEIYEVEQDLKYQSMQSTIPSSMQCCIINTPHSTSNEDPVATEALDEWEEVRDVKESDFAPKIATRTLEMTTYILIRKMHKIAAMPATIPKYAKFIANTVHATKHKASLVCRAYEKKATPYFGYENASWITWTAQKVLRESY